MELYGNKKMILQEFNWTSWLFACYLILDLTKCCRLIHALRS